MRGTIPLLRNKKKAVYILNIYVGIPEFEVKNSAKPKAKEAKQKEKIADVKKNENNKGKDVNGEDEEDSSESDTEDEVFL